MSLLNRKSISAKLHRVTSKTRHVFDTLNQARKGSESHDPQAINQEVPKGGVGKASEGMATSKPLPILGTEVPSGKVKPVKGPTYDLTQNTAKPGGLSSGSAKGAVPPRAMPNMKKSKTFGGLTVTAKVAVTFPKRSVSTPKCCGNCGAPIPLDGEDSFAIVSAPQFDERIVDVSALTQDIPTLPPTGLTRQRTLANTKPNVSPPPSIPLINIIESDTIIEEEYLPPINDNSLLNISRALIQADLLQSAVSERHLPPLDDTDSTLEDLSFLLPSFALSILDEPAPPALWEQAIAHDFEVYLAEESKKNNQRNHSFSIPSNLADESDALIDETFGWDLSFSDLSSSLPAISEERPFLVPRFNARRKNAKRRDEETIIISEAIKRSELPRDPKGELESVVDWDLPSFDMSDALRPRAIKFANGLAISSGKSILSWELPPSRFSKDPWDNSDMLQAAACSRIVRPVAMRRASTASSIGSRTTISTAYSRPSSVGTVDTCITVPNSVSFKASVKSRQTGIPRSRLPIRR